MVSYNEIASEYYDAQRHPTCANFREASAQIVDADHGESTGVVGETAKPALRLRQFLL